MYSIKVRENILIAHSLPGEVFGPAQNMHAYFGLVQILLQVKNELLEYFLLLLSNT